MPAQNAFPFPENTMDLQSGSFPKRLNASPISLQIREENVTSTAKNHF